MMPKTIDVWDHTCERYQGAILSIQLGAVRKNPSAEEVCDWAHEGSVRRLDFDQDVAVFDFDWIYRNLGIGVVRCFAGFGIVLPAVPGADDLAVLDHALTERTAAVQSDIVHGAVDAVHVGDADG